MIASSNSKTNLRKFTEFFVQNKWPWHATFWTLHIVGRLYSYYITVLYYPKSLLVVMLICEVIFIGLVYLTIWMYKRLSKQNLFLIGIPTWIAYISIISYCQVSVLSAIPENEGLKWIQVFIGHFKPFMITFILLILAKYFKDSFIEQWHSEQSKKLQLQSELQNLKAQVSPHFLFNTLNNFYGLAVESSSKLPDLMIRLSGLLRYSLYETQNTVVPLKSEITYLKNYMELEKIRLEDDLIFELNVSEYESQELEIAPLLLIVIVENAFKHAKNLITKPLDINIDFTLTSDGVMHFQVINNCVGRMEKNEFEYGIGLNNLQRRLEMLYPSPHHELNVIHIEDVFKVSLKINLKYLKA